MLFYLEQLHMHRSYTILRNLCLILKIPWSLDVCEYKQLDLLQMEYSYQCQGIHVVLPIVHLNSNILSLSHK